MKTVCKEEEIIKEEKAEINSLVLYKQFDEKRNDLIFKSEKEINEANVNTFINSYAKAFFKPYSYSLFLRIYAFKEPAFLLFANCTVVGNDTCDEYKKVVGNVARQMYENEKNGKLSKEAIKENENFIYTFVDLGLGGFEKYLAKKVNINKEDKLPLIKVMVGKEVYGYQGDLNAEKIANEFMMKYFKKQLIPVEKKVDL